MTATKKRQIWNSDVLPLVAVPVVKYFSIKYGW